MKTRSEEEYNRTLTFYHDILGLEIVREWENGIMFDTGAGLIEIFKNGNGEPERGVIRHFAFAVDDVDACADKISQAGYEIFVGPKDILIPSDPSFPARMAFCHGPLSEEIEFFHEIQE